MAFGPSQAIVQTIQGQNVQQVERLLKFLLRRADVTMQDVASLVGAPDDTSVTVKVGSLFGAETLEVQTASSSMAMRHFIGQRFDKKAFVENDQVDVAQPYQGKGRGTRIIGR
jgi:hypothetical protein